MGAAQVSHSYLWVRCEFCGALLTAGLALPDPIDGEPQPSKDPELTLASLRAL